MKAKPPGLHKGVREAHYHRWDAISHSLLKIVRQQTPAHALQYIQHPPEPSEAMAFGSALHYACLEPDDFSRHVVQGLDLPRRKKADQETWAQFEEKNKRKIILKHDKYEHCVSMAEAVTRHPRAMSILEAPGHREVSMTWEDPDTGLLCKARPDILCRYRGRNLLVDLKTIAGYTPATDFKPASGGASDERVSRQCAAFAYDMQAAFYLTGANAIAPADYEFWFIFVEKTAPYGVHVMKPSLAMLASGEDKVRLALKRWKKCIDEDVFPAYGNDVDVIPWSKFNDISQEEMEELFDEEAA